MLNEKLSLIADLHKYEIIIMGIMSLFQAATPFWGLFNLQNIYFSVAPRGGGPYRDGHERCVIFTKATITSQSMDSTWTHGARHTYPKLAKTFPFWVTVKFPEFSLIFGVFRKFPEFSLTGKLDTHFQGFP